MQRAATLLYRTYLVWIFLGGLAWIFDLPSKLGLPLIQYEWLAPYLGVAVAAVLLKYPYGKHAGLAEVLGRKPAGQETGRPRMADVVPFRPARNKGRSDTSCFA